MFERLRLKYLLKKIQKLQLSIPNTQLLLSCLRGTICFCKSCLNKKRKRKVPVTKSCEPNIIEFAQVSVMQIKSFRTLLKHLILQTLFFTRSQQAGACWGESNRRIKGKFVKNTLTLRSRQFFPINNLLLSLSVLTCVV